LLKRASGEIDGAGEKASGSSNLQLVRKVREVCRVAPIG
jgi:hypothetical protein